MPTYEKDRSPVYNVITEQGDLGLGAFILNESDQKVMQENEKKSKKKNKEE